MGVPAHVTVLLPFMPADKVNNESLAAMRDLFRSEPRFSYRLAISLIVEDDRGFWSAAAAFPLRPRQA